MIAKLIEQWDAKGCGDERETQESLSVFLQRQLPRFTIVRQYGHDRLRADIVIEGKVAIELKFGLNSTSNFQRLIGQIEEYEDWGIRLLIVLIGNADQDLVHRLEKRIERPIYDEIRLIRKFL